MSSNIRNFSANFVLEDFDDSNSEMSVFKGHKYHVIRRLSADGEVVGEILQKKKGSVIVKFSEQDGKELPYIHEALNCLYIRAMLHIQGISRY